MSTCVLQNTVEPVYCKALSKLCVVVATVAQHILQVVEEVSVAATCSAAILDHTCRAKLSMLMASSPCYALPQSNLHCNHYAVYA